VNKISNAASLCVNSYRACEFPKFNFPNLNLPERKLHSSQEVFIYANPNFEEPSQVLLAGHEYDDANGEITIGNDTLSSIKVPDGIVVRLYEHFHFQGKLIDIRTDTPETSLVWNDRTSSIRVSKPDELIPITKEVIIFEHDGLGGAFQILSIGEYDGVNQPLQVGNGLSSALIPKGMVLRLYEQPNFGGAQIEFREDMTMANHLDWNDRTKSIKVYEDGKEIPA
jgi:Beta/Gamma crystallin